MAIQPNAPARASYDVIIVGGAIMGASAAWFLSDNDDFDGSVLVVEKDPTYQNASTAHTTSCMRQQFSTELNVPNVMRLSNLPGFIRIELYACKEIVKELQ